MRKYAKKHSFTFIKLLEYLGKPSFYAFQVLTVTIFILISKLHFPKLRLLPTPKSSYLKLLPMFISIIIFLPLAWIVNHNLFVDLPDVNLLKSNQPSLTTKIYDRHGTLLFQIYKNENRRLIHLSELPPHLIAATLAAEDKNFYHHPGVDFVGIARASFNNARCQLLNLPCSLQGGSTITQQLIKNTLLTPEKTYIRKLKELILALRTEYLYSKDEILEMYLNQVGYGGTAYGIEQASMEYFGKNAKDLTLAESAMLAGLPISPTILSPFGTTPYLSKIRQRQVLESMVKLQIISEDQKVQTLSSPLTFNPQGISIRAPHFVMYIKDLLVKEYGEELVSRGGLEVVTSLDLTYQDVLQQEVEQELKGLAKLSVKNGAGLILNPGTGEILAMVGSRDFFDNKNDGQVNIVVQPRQPGSSIKPITYALALSSGATPLTTIEDAPVCFVSAGQKDYCPKNYDGKFHGSVTLRTALASSYNIPAVKLLNNYGLSNMINLGKKLGITTWEDPSRYGLSLTLGGGEVTMLDLASVYSVFANSGFKVPLSPILHLNDSLGNPLPNPWQPTLPAELVLSETVSGQINSILSDPLARSPAFGSNSILNLPGRGVAVKTGTTNNLRDNWTFGYTKDLLVATWVGNNDNSPMSHVASGITGASPIWAKTMKVLLDRSNLASSLNQGGSILESGASTSQ